MSFSISLSVFPDVGKVEKNREEDGERQDDDDGHLSRNVLWGVLLLKRFRPDDVAQAKGH